jgi:ribose transport system substrate-binding protein
MDTESLNIPQQDSTIAVLTKSQGVEFWETVENGAKNAGEELGIQIVCEATETESDIDDQISMINDLINQGVDGIVVAPLDTEALNDVLAKATDAGIPIITIDSTVSYDEVLSEIGTSNISAGEIAARNMAELIDNKGDVVVITHGSDSVLTAKQRKQGFVQAMLENFSSINVVADINGEADTDIAKEKILECLKENPSIKGIYATNESVAVGACQAVEELGLAGQVKIIGFDSSNTEISYLEDGVLNGMMVQNPYLFGYLAVRNMSKAIDGKRIDSSINTGITFVNNENLEDQDVQVILYPNGKES